MRGLGGVVVIDGAIGAHGRSSRPAHYFIDKCLCLLCLEGHVRPASGHTLQIRVRFDTLIFETRKLLLLLLLLLLCKYDIWPLNAS